MRSLTTENVKISSKIGSVPVCDKAVVVDVPGQPDYSDSSGPQGDDEGGPDAHEDEEEPEDQSKGDLERHPWLKLFALHQSGSYL